MLAADELVDAARRETGLSDFGATGWREGYDRLIGALNTEAALSEGGEQIMGLRLGMLLANRLRITAVLADHPEIDEVEIEGPLFIIGLPRTGTTALSNLVAADPRIRSLRLWESSDPVPPPDAATAATDPRIEAARGGLDAMYTAFPRMRSLHFQAADGPTECQDLLGMEFRAAHFDGMARVPGYVDWLVDSDMTSAYAFHRRVLQLLCWRCPPRLWHLKTPVHMLALDALVASYPGARFLWTHRDPAAVLGSVCSLIAYTRSWVSDRADPYELGLQQLDLWAEAVRRAMDFRGRVGESAFADVSFDALQSDPVGALSSAYDRLGMPFGRDRGAVDAWARAHPPGSRGTHEFALGEFGLDAARVRGRFADYLGRFSGPVGPLGDAGGSDGDRSD